MTSLILHTSALLQRNENLLFKHFESPKNTSTAKHYLVTLIRTQFETKVNISIHYFSKSAIETPEQHENLFKIKLI